MMNYRNEARQHLKRANTEIDTGDDERLKYAALELRMAMEALTYNRVLAYKDEFPPAEYETWQPRKVTTVLLDIDPAADKDSTLVVGRAEQYGVAPPASAALALGSEKVLNMATLREHYDALGSYLHKRSMKQVRLGKAVDFGRIRARCTDIAAFVEIVLGSPVFNVTLGSFSTLECVECSTPIRKRMPHGQTEAQAECYECRATYTIVNDGKGQIAWNPHQHEVTCANERCDRKIVVWHHEFEVGRCWTCPDCRGAKYIRFGNPA